MLRAVYSYLGKDPNSQNADDLVKAEAVLTKIRPYIRNINSSEYIEALVQRRHLPRGRLQRRRIAGARPGSRGREGHRSQVRGAQGRLDTVVRHAGRAEDAAQSRERYAFLNYILNPPGHRRYIDFKRYANAICKRSHCSILVRDDPAIYPREGQQEKLAVQLADSSDQTRAITRVWPKVQDGQ